MIRELTAAEFLSGRVVLHSVIGEGLNTLKQIENGIPILSEDVIIQFSNGKLRKFYKTDKVSMDFVYEEIRAEVDFYNTGTKLRPIYSPPSGHLNTEKKKTHSTVYVYDLQSLVTRKAKLPFYLYVNDSGKRNGHVTVLARNVQIRIADGKYLDFEKDKCTVDEVLSVCDENSRKEMPPTSALRYSIASGYKHRRADGSLVYDLLDILTGDAKLPIGEFASYERITGDVHINIGDKVLSFKKGDLTEKVEIWRNDISKRNTVPYGFLCDDPLLKDTPKTFRIIDLMTNKASLPVIAGYLLGEDVIIQFVDKSEKLYKQNFLFSEIWNDIYTLYVMSKVEEFGYPNPIGPKIFQRLLLKEKMVISAEDTTTTSDESLLIGYKDHVRSVVVLKNLTVLSDIAERFNNIMNESENLTQKVFFARRK